MKSDLIIFIVGPTAVGKSDVALELAKKIKGEIVSCDAMQVYREITIASNKPSNKILKEIPHHLINVVSVENEFDVAKFNQLALAAIKKILLKKCVPIIVGGSGLYMQVLLDGIFDGASKNESLRQEYEKIAAQKGNQFLYEKLKIQDPDAAKKIHPNNIKRVIRALEVCALHKTPLSRVQKNRSGIWGKYDIRIFALTMEREKMYELINDRVERMFDQGLVDEVKKLRDIKLSKTASLMIGVKEIKAYLDGEYDLNRAKSLIKQNTRHYAKRQLTWFRKEKRLSWVSVEDVNHLQLIVKEIFNHIKSNNKKGIS